MPYYTLRTEKSVGTILLFLYISLKVRFELKMLKFHLSALQSTENKIFNSQIRDYFSTRHYICNVQSTAIYFFYKLFISVVVKYQVEKCYLKIMLKCIFLIYFCKNIAEMHCLHDCILHSIFIIRLYLIYFLIENLNKL